MGLLTQECAASAARSIPAFAMAGETASQITNLSKQLGMMVRQKEECEQQNELRDRQARDKAGEIEARSRQLYKLELKQDELDANIEAERQKLEWLENRAVTEPSEREDILEEITFKLESEVVKGEKSREMLVI